MLVKKFSPHFIFGLGSYIDPFFCYMAQNNLKLPDLKVVTYGGDHLRPEVKSIIEQRFCPVFNSYVAVETGNIAFECDAHCGYHLNIDTCAVGIADKDDFPVSPGIKGEIVISNLINKGTVLLNYKLGDIGVMDEDNATCKCGRNLPFFKESYGQVLRYSRSTRWYFNTSFNLFITFQKEDESNTSVQIDSGRF